MTYTQNKNLKTTSNQSHHTLLDEILNTYPELSKGNKLIFLADGTMDTDKKLRTLDNFTSLPSHITTLMITDHYSWKSLCDQLGIALYMVSSTILKSIMNYDLEYVILLHGNILHKEKVVSDNWTDI